MNIGQLALDNIEKYGEYTSLHFEGQSFTNVQQDVYARKLATVLSEYGVGPDDRVLVMMPNCPEVTAAFQACWKIGAVIIPVTPMLNAREVGYLMENSGAQVALTKPVLAARVNDARSNTPSVKHVLVIGQTDAEGTTDISAKIEAAKPKADMVERNGDDLAILLYTSGTTGQPKGVMLTHSNLMTNAKATGTLAELPPQGMSMHVLPLSHAFGILMMNMGYFFGACSVMLTHFDAKKALESIQTFKVRQFSAVPTMLTYLLNHPDRNKYDFSSLERVVTGGAALPNEVRLDFEREFNCQVREGYGLSETAPTAAGYHQDEDYRPGSVGRAIPDVQVCIMDDANKPLAVGETGEICIKGPNIMKGYWKNEKATEGAIIDGWFHSGDVGRMDDEGYIYITDRKKDLIIKGGENISPREIEEAIYEHPAVAECAVVGVPCVTFGEDICAVVSLKPGQKATEGEIVEHCRDYVTKFKLPRFVHFMPFLPKNMVGKILKKDLRKMMADHVRKIREREAAVEQAKAEAGA